MSCTIDYEFRLRFPRTVEIQFLSHTGDEVTNAKEELRKLGNATAAPLIRNLRPMTSLNEITSAKEVFLEKLQFNAIDVTNTAATEQDADTIAAIIASRTGSKAYAQSQYKNGLIPVNFQPNYCRPVMNIDGKKVIPALNTAPSYEDLGIGIIVPNCLEINAALGKVSAIQFYSAFAQYIEETNKYQNYPLLVQATFWTSAGAIKCE